MLHNILINCELPHEMFKFNYDLNDFDFVLFHLMQTDHEYYEYYKSMRMVHPDRIMILDNSAYEYFVKGEELDLVAFKNIIEDLKPTFYILPDVLMDKEKTLQKTKEFLTLYHINCKAEPMAVAQGMTEDDLIECINEYKSLGLKNICLPFHNKFYKEYKFNPWVMRDFMKYYNIPNNESLTDDMKYAIGRVSFIMKHWSLWDDFDYIHILGSHCPFEKRFYFRFNSMDTGYPVKLGYEGKLLGQEKEKPKTIIDDFFRSHLTQSQMELIRENMKIFKQY